MKNLCSASVLAMSLASGALAQSVVVDGFVHDPLGSVRLSTSPTGHLAVSNIGSSGLDGVRVNLPNPETHTVHFENGIEFAGFESVELRATVRNTTVGTASVALRADPAIGVQITPDFSAIGATGVRFLLFTDGVIGGMFDGLGALVVPPNGASPVSLHGVCNRRLSNDMMRLHFEPHDIVGAVVKISVDGGPEIACDELRLLPLGLSFPIVELLSTEILVSGTPSLVWSDESASGMGTGFKGLGAVVLGDPPAGSVCKECLIVPNIGASGDDGVLFVVGNDPPAIQPGADSFTIALDEAGPAVCNDGSPPVFYVATGTSSTSGETQFLSTVFDNNADAVEVQTEFSVGGSSVNVKIYYHGVEVLEGSVPAGVPALRILRDIPGEPGVPGTPIAIDRMRVETGHPPDPGMPGIPASSSFSLVAEAMIAVGTLPLVLGDSVVMSANTTGTIETEILSMCLSGTSMPDVHVDMKATGQTPKTSFGLILKPGGLADFRPTLTSSGQTAKVEVRGWDPEAKKAIQGFVGPVTGTIGRVGGVAASFRSATLPHVDGIMVLSVAQIASDPIEFDHVMPAVGSIVRVSGQDSSNPHGAGQRVIEARLNGRVVSRVLAFAPYTDVLFDAPLLGAVGLDFEFAAWNRSGIVKLHCRSYCYQYQSPEMTTVAGGVPVLADEVQVTYCDLALPPSPIRGVIAEQEHGFGGDLGVANMKLVAHELTHTIQGRATWGLSALDPSEPGYGEDLKVRNIGSSGQDGVLIDLTMRPDSHTATRFLPEVDDEVLVVFAEGDPDRPVVIGSVWNAKVDFTAPPDNGTPPLEPVVVRGLRHELGHALDVDFGPQYVNVHTVSVWDDTDIVHVVTASSSSPFDVLVMDSDPPPGTTTPDGVIRLGVITNNEALTGTFHFRVKVKFPWVRPIQMADGTVVMGDRVEISAEGKSGNESSPIATLRLGGHNTPGFTITDVRTNRGPCQSDMNGDGILDNGDIGTFINRFLTGDLSSDMNNDTILDNGDIGVFITLFLAGC